MLKQIPKSVSTRITANSCNEDIFRKSTLFYNSVLHDCGFKENIKYCPEESVSSRTRKNRSRNIIWYNLPSSKNVETNVGKYFFKLLKKHFGKNCKYHKIFNKNNIKVSYSCMDNMAKIINSHNKYVASKKVQANQNLCSCRNPDNCPLDNKCLKSKIVYSAAIITDSQRPSKFYLGICEIEFKTRFNDHKKSFCHRQNEKDTELSKYIWELKDKRAECQIRLSIAPKSSGYNPVTKSCNLCLLEKLLLCNFSDKSRLRNKRLDLVSKCRHENKHMLKNYSGVK